MTKCPQHTHTKQTPIDPAPWPFGPGPWTLDPGPWTLDPGPWALGPGPCTLHPGRDWTLYARRRSCTRTAPTLEPLRAYSQHAAHLGGEGVGSVDADLGMLAHAVGMDAVGLGAGTPSSGRAAAPPAPALPHAHAHAAAAAAPCSTSLLASGSTLSAAVSSCLSVALRRLSVSLAAAAAVCAACPLPPLLLLLLLPPLTQDALTPTRPSLSEGGDAELARKREGEEESRVGLREQDSEREDAVWVNAEIEGRCWRASKLSRKEFGSAHQTWSRTRESSTSETMSEGAEQRKTRRNEKVKERRREEGAGERTSCE
eukprot:1010445-Rhodomonas_salina.1